MADTFVKIASVTVGSGGTSAMDFTSIPSTYTDLCLKVSTRDSNWVVALKFNGLTTNQTIREVVGTGSSATSANTTKVRGYVSGGATSSTFGSTEFYIPNYAGSNYKSVSVDGVGEENATTAYMGLGAGLWSSTAAITQLTVVSDSGATIPQYSTAVLYGIKNS